ncbi:hypothetical protein BgiBS90_004063, partial [Biomphalaria glabrata]
NLTSPLRNSIFFGKDSKEDQHSFGIFLKITAMPEHNNYHFICMLEFADKRNRTIEIKKTLFFYLT